MQVNRVSQNRITRKEPSFKATINIVTDKKVFDYALNMVPESFKVGSNWVIEEAAVLKRTAHTLTGRNCVVGSIFNPESKRVNMFHIAPSRKNMDDISMIKDTIYEQALQLKNNSLQRLEGFLTGGNNSRDRYGYSNPMLRTIENTFWAISEELGMDFSVVAGREDLCNEIHLISDARTNNHYLFPDAYKKPILGAQELSDFFEKKIISPNDKFKLNGEDITEEFKRIIANKHSIIDDFAFLQKKIMEIKENHLKPVTKNKF